MRPPELFELGPIRLRRPRLEDAEAIFEYGSDPEVARYADWRVQSDIGPIREALAQRAADWERGEKWYWVIALPRDDRAIGGISCVPEGASAELGYLVHRKHWGKGYATRAVKATIAWLGSCPPFERAWASCDTENAASIRVLEKAGFMREGMLPRYAPRPQLGDEPRDAYRYALSLHA